MTNPEIHSMNGISHGKSKAGEIISFMWEASPDRAAKQILLTHWGYLYYFCLLVKEKACMVVFLQV